MWTVATDESPNAAPGHEEVPDLKGVRDAYSMEEFLGKITAGATVPDVLHAGRKFECLA